MCVIFSHLTCFTTLKTICFKCTESYRMILLLINYKLTFVTIRDYEEQPIYKKSCFISTPVITKDARKYSDLATLKSFINKRSSFMKLWEVFYIYEGNINSDCQHFLSFNYKITVPIQSIKLNPSLFNL